MRINKDGKFILVNYFLNRLVDNLEIIPVTEQKVTKVTKMFQDEKREWHEETLSEDDYKLLDRLFMSKGMDFNLVKYDLCTEFDFEQFKEVFESSEIKPNWAMKPYYTDYALGAKKNRETLKSKHIKQLENSIKSGIIKIFSMQHLPLTEIEEGSIISREHVDLYLQGLGLTISDMPLSSTETTETPVPTNQKDETALLRNGINGLRDLDAAAWIKECQPDIENMTNSQIEQALIKRNLKLWGRGFDDWNRNQIIWPKKKSGRKRQEKP